MVNCDEETKYGVDKALCFRVDIAIDKPLKRGQKVALEGRIVWIDLRYVKLPDFYYICGMLGHVTKGCDYYNPQCPESELQYGDWLRASPMKSRRQGVDAAIREEKKLYLAFRGVQQVPRARIKLSFEGELLKSLPPDATASQVAEEQVQHVAIDAMDIAVLGNEVSK